MISIYAKRVASSREQALRLVERVSVGATIDVSSAGVVRVNGKAIAWPDSDGAYRLVSGGRVETVQGLRLIEE